MLSGFAGVHPSLEWRREGGGNFFRFASTITVAGVSRCGGVYDADAGVFGRRSAVQAWLKRSFVLDPCSVSFNARSFDCDSYIRVGSAKYYFEDFDVVSEDTLLFSSYLDDSDLAGLCFGTFSVRVHPSERSADVFLSYDCSFDCYDVADVVFSEYSSRCGRYSKDGGLVFYRCEVSFVPRYERPHSACDLLRKYLDLVSCEASGDRVVAVVDFPEGDWDSVSHICDDPEDYAVAVVASALFSDSDVVQYFRDERGLGDEWDVSAEVYGNIVDGFRVYVDAKVSGLDVERLGDFL